MRSASFSILPSTPFSIAQIHLLHLASSWSICVFSLPHHTCRSVRCLELLALTLTSPLTSSYRVHRLSPRLSFPHEWKKKNASLPLANGNRRGWSQLLAVLTFFLLSDFSHFERWLTSFTLVRCEEDRIEKFHSFFFLSRKDKRQRERERRDVNASMMITMMRMWVKQRTTHCRFIVSVFSCVLLVALDDNDDNEKRWVAKMRDKGRSRIDRWMCRNKKREWQTREREKSEEKEIVWRTFLFFSYL